MSHNQPPAPTSADTLSAAKTDSSKSADVQPISCVYMGPPELYTSSTYSMPLVPVAPVTAAQVSTYAAPALPAQQQSNTPFLDNFVPSQAPASQPPTKQDSWLEDLIQKNLSQIKATAEDSLATKQGAATAAATAAKKENASSTTSSGSTMIAPSYPGLFSCSSANNNSSGASASSDASIDFSDAVYMGPDDM